MIVSDGFKGNAKTISEMWKLVNKSTKDYGIIRIATSIAKDIPARDDVGTANAIFLFVKNNIKYMPNPTGTEMISDPWMLLDRGAGDCAETSILVASLAQALGMTVRFKTVLTHLETEEVEAVKNGAEVPNKFNHIYTQFYFYSPRLKKYDWFAADTTEVESYLGWEPPDKEILRMKIWENPLFKEGLGANWLAEQWDKLTEKGKESLQKQFNMTTSELFSQFTDKKKKPKAAVPSLPAPVYQPKKPEEKPELPWISKYGKYLIWGIGGVVGLIAIISLLKKDKKS